MASIEERQSIDGKISYRVKVRLKGYPAQTATFERKTDAQKWIQDTESAIRNGRHFKTSASKKHTLSDIIERYTKENLDLSHKSTANQRHYLKWWNSELGEYTLADVSASLITKTRNSLIGKKNDYGREISPTTANRYTTALGHVFTIAVNEWELIEINPITKIKKLPEKKGRDRFLEENEKNQLLEACKESDNPYLYLIVILAISTGARKSEILNLKWKDIDFDRQRVTVHETKNGEKRSLQIRGLAFELIKSHSKVRNLRCDYVFPSKKKCQPIDIRTAWENAVIKAKLEDFRFHDLRHTAASYLAMNGASLAEIAEILGHKTLQMVKRYAHLTDSHTAGVVERMNERFLS